MVFIDVSVYTFLPLKILSSLQNFLGNVVPRKSNFLGWRAQVSRNTGQCQFQLFRQGGVEKCLKMSEGKGGM